MSKAEKLAELKSQMEALEAQSDNDSVSSCSDMQTLETPIKEKPKRGRGNPTGRPPLPRPEKAFLHKEKKPATQKQLEAMEKARIKRHENFLKRKEINDEILKERDNQIKEIKRKQKEQLEEKLVRKAVAVKKKAIKAQKILEDTFSDDDDTLDVEELKAMLRERKNAIQNPKPKKIYTPKPQKENIINQPVKYVFDVV